MSIFLRNHAWILISKFGKTFMLIPTPAHLADGVVLEASPDDDNLMLGRLVGGGQLSININDIKILQRMGV